jgi:hypothetical protein
MIFDMQRMYSVRNRKQKIDEIVGLTKIAGIDVSHG